MPPSSQHLLIKIDSDNDEATYHAGIVDGPSSEKKNDVNRGRPGVLQISTGLMTNCDWSFRIYTHLSASSLPAAL